DRRNAWPCRGPSALHRSEGHRGEKNPGLLINPTSCAPSEFRKTFYCENATQADATVRPRRAIFRTTEIMRLGIFPLEPRAFVPRVDSEPVIFLSQLLLASGSAITYAYTPSRQYAHRNSKGLLRHNRER